MQPHDFSTRYNILDNTLKNLILDFLQIKIIDQKNIEKHDIEQIG